MKCDVALNYHEMWNAFKMYCNHACCMPTFIIFMLLSYFIINTGHGQRDDLVDVGGGSGSGTCEFVSIFATIVC